MQIEKESYLDIRRTLFLPSIPNTLDSKVDKLSTDKSDDESFKSFQHPIKLINEKNI